MNLKEISPHLKTSTPFEIFKKIVSFNEREENFNKRATTQIILASGLIIEGIPLKVDADGNAILITVNNSISYINVQTINGIQILNPVKILNILTNDTYFEISEKNISTNLELKRILKKQCDTFQNSYDLKLTTQVLKNGLTLAQEKYQFEQFLNILHEVVLSIYKDSLGKESLSELSEIHIYLNDENISIQKENTVLKVGANFKNKFNSDFKNQLKVAFESII